MDKNTQTSLAGGGIGEEEKLRQAKKSELQKKYRQLSIMLVSIIIVSVLIYLFTAQKCLFWGHKWQAATCTTAQTCSDCGSTEGSTLPHKWEAATCSIPKTCSICGTIEGTTLHHQWIDSTCTAPKICSVCEVTNGTSLGHRWSGDSTDALKKCERCLKAFEYYYGSEKEEPLAWTEFDIGAGGELTNPVSYYAHTDKFVQWMHDGQVQTWSSYEALGHISPYMYYANGKVYYFDQNQYSTNEQIAEIMAQAAARHVSFRVYMWSENGRMIHMATEDGWDFFDTTVGTAYLAVDADGKKYVIVHKGEGDENPLDTYVIQINW